MTAQFVDDFKGYGTTVALLADGLFSAAQFTFLEDPDPNATGPVPWFVNFGDALRRPLSGVRATVGISGRYWFSSLLNTSTALIRIEDTSTAVQISVRMTSVGGLQIWHGLPLTGTLLGETPGPVVTANSWNHISLKALSDAAAGTAEIQVNGVSKLALTGKNTGAAYAQVEWSANDGVHGNSDQPFFLKDMFVWDGLGTQNNDFPGVVQVIGRPPTSDVLTGWTPASGASQFAMIDNSPPLDSTQYLTAPLPLPGPSSFGLAALPVDVTSVRALISQCRVRNVDGGDGSFQASLVSAVNTTDGTNRPMTSAFTYYEDVHELDPDTAAPYTPAAANAVKLKINRTV